MEARNRAAPTRQGAVDSKLLAVNSKFTHLSCVAPAAGHVRGPKRAPDAELTILPARSDNCVWGRPSGGKQAMAADPNAVEQAVSRTLRDNLGRIQRMSEELHQAISDLVSACASNRAANALPPMVRAQTSAASLSAALEALTRFVTTSLQSSLRSPFEDEMLRLTSAVVAEPPPAPDPPVEPRLPKPMDEGLWSAPPIEAPQLPELSRFEMPPSVEAPRGEPVPVFVHESIPQMDQVIAVEPPLEIELPEPESGFSLASLPADEQELHRRAYRVAKVSMQDIKLLRPEDVRAGRENRDLCIRLRDDIEKAHKEYDRRFQAIQSHPVDYFYDWMVEILAGGNPEALGAYPYPSPVLRH